MAPDLQGKGIGDALLERVETRARELRFKEISLDTSEKADRLISTYKKRGYRLVGNVSWDSTNYRSVIMSKALDL